MATTGVLYPASFAATGWTNGTNCRISDNSRATKTFASSESQITVWNFGFAIPAGATIDGIILYQEGSRTVALDYTYHQIIHANNGIPKSVQTKGISPAATETTLTAGSSTDLWGGVDADNGGTYDRDWTYSDINDVYFGAQMNYAAAASTTVSIDSLGIEVYYTVSAGGSGSRMMMMGIGI